MNGAVVRRFTDCYSSIVQPGKFISVPLLSRTFT